MLIGWGTMTSIASVMNRINGSYNIKDDPNIRKYAETIFKKLREYANPDSLGYDDEPAYEEFTSGKSLCTLMVPRQ